MNPYLIQPPALLSISGGRTSGFMLRQILDAHGGKLPDGVHATFANTGKERHETLDFVNEIQTRWDVPITWLEYRYEAPDDSPEPEEVAALRGALGDDFEVTAKQMGKHAFAVVDYATASRDGEPFAALIKSRSFLPNPVMRYCTQELKVRVMKKHALSLGLEEWDMVLGLRADEPVRVHRAQLSCARERWTNQCPMNIAGHGLDDVMRFWLESPFDLQLRQDEGNCDLCFLKGAAKLDRLIRERPESTDWWSEQETKIGGTFRADRPSYRNMRLQVLEQGRLFDESCEFDVCNCTD